MINLWSLVVWKMRTPGDDPDTLESGIRTGCSEDSFGVPGGPYESLVDHLVVLLAVCLRASCASSTRFFFLVSLVVLWGGAGVPPCYWGFLAVAYGIIYSHMKTSGKEKFMVCSAFELLRGDQYEAT